jgi:hypothetical protein
MTTYPRVHAALLLLLGFGCVSAAPAAAADDRYLAGYTSAILERQLQMPGRAFSVRDGVVTVDVADLDPGRRDSVIAALAGIPGVVEVRPATAGVAVSPPPAPPASGPVAASGSGVASAPAESPSVAVTASAAPTSATAPADVSAAPALHVTQLGLLPGGQIFNPLIADPRWPHFSAAYQRYLSHDQLKDVAAVSFGETFSIYRGALGPGFWEVGVQAGVFAIFDLDADSKDLINADYFIAALGAYRIDRFSALARLSHTSSHLGDEFVLANRVQRVNLSYESVDGKLSYDIGPWIEPSNAERGAALRVYIGGGYLFDRDPDSLKPWSAQGGVEFRSPWTLGDTKIRPVAAVDVQMREENNWGADVSARAGLQFDGILLSRNMQILVEYFHGHSPNGQFYKDRIDYLGLGVHFHF